MLSSMDTDPRTLGQRIAGLRHAQAWSQRRLAEAAGVSHGYVAQLELGRLPSPGKFRLDAIARALNLRTSDALFSPAPASPFEPLTDQVVEVGVPWAEHVESVLPDRLPVAAVPLGRGAGEL